MHAPLPTRADPWRAAAAGETLQGTLAPDRVPRIVGVARLDAPLEASLRFALDDAGTPAVEIEVRGCYGFTCQRCLQPMQDRRCDRSRVLVAADDGADRTSDAGAEVVTCARGGSLDLAALVEDEVLLALPLAPCHAREDCGGEPPHRAGATAPAQPARGGDNPFAVLAALRGGAKDD